MKTFWQDSKYARDSYIEKPPTPALVASIEEELGYALPKSYVRMMKKHNGGIPSRTCFPTKKATSWADDHVAIHAISAIGRAKAKSLCGERGSKFMLEEWGYPAIGVVFADCPSAGHDVIMFDYRKCGARGEPSVVHVDQERDYAITRLAKDFDAFVRGLVDESEFEEDEDERTDAEYGKVRDGNFTPLLARLCAKAKEVDDVESKVRALGEALVEEKGMFMLHADALSYFTYDVQLWLYAHLHPRFSREKLLRDYPKSLVFGAEFSTGGYGPGFVTDWLDKRVKSGDVVKSKGELALSPKAAARIAKRFARF